MVYKIANFQLFSLTYLRVFNPYLQTEGQQQVLTSTKSFMNRCLIYSKQLKVFLIDLFLVFFFFVILFRSRSRSLTSRPDGGTFTFVSEKPDRSERSRAAASHGVESQSYSVQTGTPGSVYAPSFNGAGTKAVNRREAHAAAAADTETERALRRTGGRIENGEG